MSRKIHRLFGVPQGPLDGDSTPVCRKFGYVSRAEAKAAIRRTEADPNYRESGVPFVAYRCESCQWWHIGHYHAHAKDPLTRRSV